MAKYFNNRKAEAIRMQKAIRQEAKAYETALKAYNLLALSVLRDEFDYGTKRLERYLDKMNTKLECYNSGLIKVEELNEILKEETGISVL